MYKRFPQKDPRTVARDIPGICDVLFPQLTPGVVAYFNKKMRSVEGVVGPSEELIGVSTLNGAMLFEVAFARGEQLLAGRTEADWEDCLEIATKRQRKHFDAKLPNSLSQSDLTVADHVGQNLYVMLYELKRQFNIKEVEHFPEVPGYQWIASGNGDFSIGQNLIEVKCISRNFGAADYRQVLIYWLLSYSSAIENSKPEWNTGILLNPRRNQYVRVHFDELIRATAAGRSKIEILELFSSIVGDYSLKMLSSH